MIVAEGHWYDGKYSAQVVAALQVRDNGAVVIERTDTREVLFRQNDVRQFNVLVSDRLGNTPRVLTFYDGSVFETEDNPAIDRLLHHLKRSHWSRWIHVLESYRRYVLLAAVCILAIGTIIVRYGAPATAKLITAHLPPSIYETADRQVMDIMEGIVLKASELPTETKMRVREHLSGAIAHADTRITLLFRHGGRLGPNAFALPGGTIVFTDALIELAEHDDELLAIMAHEIGHVIHRHGMRRMVQDSLLSFAILAVTGDTSGVSALILGLPVLFTELSYSRTFEREADQYALDYLLLHQIPPTRFVDILTRIDARGAIENEDSAHMAGYLSTHPPTSERVKVFMEANP